MSKTEAYVTLLTKNGRDDARVINGTSPLTAVENNLAPWLVRLDINNTGVSKTNSGTLTLRVDGVGTFIRSGPILIDQNTKNNYLIEMQLKQDLDNDGNTSDPNEEGFVLRAMIGQPQISIDQSYGEILKINLVGIEYRLKEGMTSKDHIFQTPDESFFNRILEANNNATGIRIANSTLGSLPTSPRLTFRPFNPTKIHSTLTEIIDLLAQPQVVGGAFDDYYFDFEAHPDYTNYVNIVAEVFGEDSSGVTVDPLSLGVINVDEEQTIVTDNIEYKNHVILIGSPNGGSLPTDRAKFASNWEHAKLRDNWSQSSIAYEVGDLVQNLTPTGRNPSLITYHRCKVAHTSNISNGPIVSSANWEIDWIDIPDFISGAYYRIGEFVVTRSGGVVKFFQCITAGTHTVTPTTTNSIWELELQLPNGYTVSTFRSYTPWTNKLALWKETLAGRSINGGTGKDGWAPDWNMTKANYNRANPANHFETVSAKWVTRLETDPVNVPAEELYYGNRFLVSPTASGAWAGHLNQIAELDKDNIWRFSSNPQTNEAVNVLDVASIYIFNGTVWTPQWEPNDENVSEIPSPFHACTNVGLVAGYTGIAGQAVQFTYDWSVNLLDLANTYYNRSSRGVWIYNSFPLPYKNVTGYKAGAMYGGDGVSVPKATYINTNNMDYNRLGNEGWNQGLDVEDMGKITAIIFKLRVSMFRDASGSIPVFGQANIPLTFWCVDRFDRVWFAKFKVRRNDQFDDIRIPIGEFSQSNLYHARWDELAKFNNFVLTGLDFTLKEKEFSGVAFDWRFVKHWGIQLDESYTDVGLYKNHWDRAWDYSEDVMDELKSQIPLIIGGPGGTIIYNQIRNLLPDKLPVRGNYVRLSAKITLDDLHFEKELVCTSDDFIKSDPRTMTEYVSTESDYNNLKARAVAMEFRKRFFPQFWHIRATGDVRLRFGKRFTISGSRVPNGSQEMVISAVKHIFDHDGYHVEITGVRKFTTSG